MSYIPKKLESEEFRKAVKYLAESDAVYITARLWLGKSGEQQNVGAGARIKSGQNYMDLYEWWISKGDVHSHISKEDVQSNINKGNQLEATLRDLLDHEVISRSKSGYYELRDDWLEVFKEYFPEYVLS